MYSTAHSRRAILCSPDNAIQEYQTSHRQQDIDRRISEHCFPPQPFNSQVATMANTSHSTSSSLEYTTQPAQLSCQFPMEQWFEGGTSDVDPGDLYLSLHDSIFYNDAHYTQGFSFPQSRGLEMHDYTMALDPSATLQHYATSPPVEYLQPGGLSCGNGVLDFCSMPLEAMSTVYPFSGYPEPSLFSDFGDSSENNSTPISTTNEEDEADKPYAKLIYEALMQTPGHRMTLREIYEWFVENTSKPQDSGSNGWQNSIRHNLSMNQVRPPLLCGVHSSNTRPGIRERQE